MFRSTDFFPVLTLQRAVVLAALLVSVGDIAAKDGSSDVTVKPIGRAATAAEIKAWDIDVRPDFQGLPAGSGSVEKGQGIWDNRCASCHGTFAESNEIFTPLVGGTTKEDQKNGRVAALAGNTVPQRTTFMKVATLSTLYDYIHRAMPWNAPKSLSTDEVYAVLAYLLNLAEIVPDDFVLNQNTIRDVQSRMPNRNGMTRQHGLWDNKGKPDVHNTACMQHCATEVSIISTLPDFARTANGNPYEQNRNFGAVRGVNTESGKSGGAASTGGDQSSHGADSLHQLANASGCLACHAVSSKLVGPAFTDVAAHYKGNDGALAALVAKVQTGGQGNWGQIPMPAQVQINKSQIEQLVGWILKGAP